MPARKIKLPIAEINASVIESSFAEKNITLIIGMNCYFIEAATIAGAAHTVTGFYFEQCAMH